MTAQMEADELRYKAENEMDDTKMEEAWAAFETAQSAVDTGYETISFLHQDNDYAHNQITELDSTFRITEAQLIAEQQNAELIAMINRQDYYKVDIEQRTAAIGVVQGVFDGGDQSVKDKLDEMKKERDDAQQWLDESDNLIAAIDDKRAEAESTLISVEAEIEEMAVQREVDSAMQEVYEMENQIFDVQLAIDDAQLMVDLAMDETEAKRAQATVEQLKKDL